MGACALVQFSPSTPLPIGVTDPPTNLNSPQGSVDLNGHIVTDGRDVPYYFNYGTDLTLATSTSTPQQTLTPDAGPGSYDVPPVPLDSLPPGTYYYQIVVIDENGNPKPDGIESFTIPVSCVLS